MEIKDLLKRGKYFWIILAVVLLIGLGFYLRSFFMFSPPSQESVETPPLEKKAGKDGLVLAEEITVVGKITKVGNFEIWLRAENGEEAKIILAGDVVIYRPGQKGSLNFSQAKLQENEKVMISLYRRGEKFIASSISILE